MAAMRNDARPIGHDAADPTRAERPVDASESVTHDRQSHVNRDAGKNARRRDADVDPAMPANDSTLKTKI
jgi:hypothetical protein